MAEDSLPTAEEYALFREAYAETYPVRPLLNAIDAKDAEIERLRAFVTKLANPDFSRVSSPLGPLHAAGMCAEAEIVAKLAKEVLTDEPKPLPTESAKVTTAVESIPAPPGSRD